MEHRVPPRAAHDLTPQPEGLFRANRGPLPIIEDRLGRPRTPVSGLAERSPPSKRPSRPCPPPAKPGGARLGLGQVAGTLPNSTTAVFTAAFEASEKADRGGAEDGPDLGQSRNAFLRKSPSPSPICLTSIRDIQSFATHVRNAESGHFPAGCRIGQIRNKRPSGHLAWADRPDWPDRSF